MCCCRQPLLVPPGIARRTFTSKAAHRVATSAWPCSACAGKVPLQSQRAQKSSRHCLSCADLPNLPFRLQMNTSSSSNSWNSSRMESGPAEKGRPRSRTTPEGPLGRCSCVSLPPGSASSAGGAEASVGLRRPANGAGSGGTTPGLAVAGPAEPSALAEAGTMPACPPCITLVLLGKPARMRPPWRGKCGEVGGCAQSGQQLCCSEGTGRALWMQPAAPVDSCPALGHARPANGSVIAPWAAPGPHPCLQQPPGAQGWPQRAEVPLCKAHLPLHGANAHVAYHPAARGGEAATNTTGLAGWSHWHEFTARSQDGHQFSCPA